MKQDTHVITSFEQFLSSLTVGNAATFENLMVYPVFTGNPQTNGYLLLDEAVKSGKFIITEVNEGGSVPNLKVTNGLDFDVILLDGDILVGAKQNRSCTTTIIIEKGSSSIIDVNCVERGRWSYKGENFSGDKNPLYSRLRSSKSRSVTENLKNKRGCVADQDQVWDDISMKAASFSRRDAGFEACRTEAADALYSRYEGNVKGYEDAFQAEIFITPINKNQFKVQLGEKEHFIQTRLTVDRHIEINNQNDQATIENHPNSLTLYTNQGQINLERFNWNAINTH